MMEAVRTSETAVYFNETTRPYIPQICHFHNRRRENLKTLLKITWFRVSKLSVFKSRAKESIAIQWELKWKYSKQQEHYAAIHSALLA
jgi:hypothetical protein